MGKKIADIGDVRKEACYESIVARLADGNTLEGCILDRAQLMMKLVDRLAVLRSMVLELKRGVSRLR